MALLITKLRKVYCWVWEWNFFKSVNIWQSYKQKRDCLVHFLRLLAVFWPGAQSARDNHVLASNTHTPVLRPFFPGLPRWAGTRKVKPICILLEQEIVSGSGISWAICKSPSRSRQITTPAPHYSVFLQTGCPSCRSTNSVKALKANVLASDSAKYSPI